MGLMRGLFMLFRARGALRLAVRLMFDSRVPFGLKMIIPAAVLYFISPIDLIPDVLPIRGRIDDVLVLGVALAAFLGLAPKDVVAEHTGGPKAAGRSEKKANVIEGSYRVVDDGEESTG